MRTCTCTYEKRLSGMIIRWQKLPLKISSTSSKLLFISCGMPLVLRNRMAELQRSHQSILFSIQQSVDEMKQQFEKMMIMVQQALQGSNVNNNAAQAIDPAVPDNNQDIIILGGWHALRDGKVLNTVEKFNIVEGKSTQLPGMNLPRAESASCVYNGDVIVTGGWDGQDGTDLIEILKINQHPLRWTKFDAKLPVKLSRHIVLVYQDRIIVIGGYD